MTGGSGGDIFVFRANFGNDVIKNFRVFGREHDVIEFSTDVFATWDELSSAVADSGRGATIDAGHGNTITLLGVTKAKLVAHRADLFGSSSVFQRPGAGFIVQQTGAALNCLPFEPGERAVEWQADYYASCLLMPPELVVAAWDEVFPDGKPRVLKSTTPFNGFVEFNRETFVTPLRVETETDDQALDRFAAPFAKEFLVSPIAMRIRLEKLGLLLREVPLNAALPGGA